MTLSHVLLSGMVLLRDQDLDSTCFLKNKTKCCLKFHIFFFPRDRCYFVNIGGAHSQFLFLLRPKVIYVFFF